MPQEINRERSVLERKNKSIMISEFLEPLLVANVPLETIEQVINSEIEDLRKTHYDATHVCYAYIIDDEGAPQVNKFTCEYRAVRREELTERLSQNGCKVEWKFPEETGFYQPIAVAVKDT